MENHFILDSQIFVSSSKDYETSGPNKARHNLANSAWVAAVNDKNPWLLVDFISNVTVGEISIQGLGNGRSYVKSYSLEFGSTRDTLQEYEDVSLSKVSFFSEDDLIKYPEAKPARLFCFTMIFFYTLFVQIFRKVCNCN